MIPDLYLRPTDVDLSGPLAEFIRVNVTSAGAAALQTILTYTVPMGKILIMQSLHATMTAGAAQWPLNARAYYVKEIDAIVAGRETGKTAAYTAALRLNLLEGPQLWLPGEAMITCQGVFNAGVALNTLDISMTGWLIPRSSVVI